MISFRDLLVIIYIIRIILNRGIIHDDAKFSNDGNKRNLIKSDIGGIRVQIWCHDRRPRLLYLHLISGDTE